GSPSGGLRHAGFRFRPQFLVVFPPGSQDSEASGVLSGQLSAPPQSARQFEPFHERECMSNQDERMMPRPVTDSQSEMAQIVLPNDANPLGDLLGGRLMHWIDMAGAMAAHRHSRNYVVTASIDHLDFLVPVHIGDLVILRSSVNRAFRTSMEVGVQVLVENYHASSRKHVSSAYLTFVAVDTQRHHLAVP